MMHNDTTVRSTTITGRDAIRNDNLALDTRHRRLADTAVNSAEKALITSSGETGIERTRRVAVANGLRRVGMFAHRWADKPDATAYGYLVDAYDVLAALVDGDISDRSPIDQGDAYIDLADTRHDIATS